MYEERYSSILAENCEIILIDFVASNIYNTENAYLSPNNKLIYIQ